MTASERLERLDGEMTDGPWDNAGWHVYRGTRFTASHQPLATTHGDSEVDAHGIATLRNALPELIAVVKAAEAAAPYLPDALHQAAYPKVELDVALAALDRALGEEAE